MDRALEATARWPRGVSAVVIDVGIHPHLPPRADISAAEPTGVTSAPPPTSALGGALPRGLMLLVGIAAAVVAVAGVRAASSRAASTLLAVVLTVAALPIGRWAARRGWPAWLSAAVTVLAAYAIVLVLVGGVTLSLTQLVATLPNYSSRVAELAGEALDQLSQRGVDTGSARHFSSWIWEPW